MGQQVTKPWGQYVDHYRSPDCVFKVITVDPMQRLSLQRHYLRSETWFCLSGQGEALVNGHTQEVYRGVKIEIGCGVAHRLTNVGIHPLIVAEMQSGECDENDIVRIEDDYDRGDS